MINFLNRFFYPIYILIKYKKYINIKKIYTYIIIYIISFNTIEIK